MLKFVHVRLFNPTVTDNIDGEVYMSVYNRCVGNQVERHGIKDDIVVTLLELLDHLGHVFAQQQRGGVGRNSTNTDNVKSFMQCSAMDDIIQIGLLARQIGRCTLTVLYAYIL